MRLIILFLGVILMASIVMGDCSCSDEYSDSEEHVPCKPTPKPTTKKPTTKKPTTPKKTTTKCPPKCGKNEEWSTCANQCDQVSCSTFGKSPNCDKNKKCQGGCVCKKGYIRSIRQLCIKPTECENNVCPELNEEYTDCKSPCRETCATMGKNITCNFLVCNMGCDCKEGFFRNSAGTCVEAKNCDCPMNEYLDLCFNNCPPKTCDAIGKKFKCPAPDPNKCTPACSCYSWMRRNDQGVCVNVEDCPPKTCKKKNEVYSYQWWCFKEKCGSEDEPCPNKWYEVPYEPVCTCKRPDFCRNSKGDCVQNTGKNRCPDKNTVYKECAKPLWTQMCTSRGKNYSDVTWCEKGCECLPGMYRNLNNKCVPEDECECPINEFFDECNWYRRPESCDDIYEPYTITFPIDKSCCTPECICDYGFYRNCDGDCVPIEECPNYDCESSEDYNSCPSQYNCEDCGDEFCGFIRYADARPAQAKAATPAVGDQSASALSYISSSDKGRVTPAMTKAAEAQATPAVSPLVKGAPASPVSSQAIKATSIKIMPPRFFNYTCHPRCLCKWNEYCRNEEGCCIKNEGPESCPKENTEYSECRKYPWVQSCEMRGQEPINVDYCEKGCQCEEGYYRNTKMECVAPCDCECPVGEYYGCEDNCQPSTCRDLFKNYTGCYDKIDWTKWTCENTCNCQYGMFRNCDGDCVNVAECPCKDPNAVMVECPYKCGGGTCDQPEIVQQCNNWNCDWNNRYGCECKKGYVRRSEKDPKCIPIEKCPKKSKK